jgi:hypothetical protein
VGPGPVHSSRCRGWPHPCRAAPATASRSQDTQVATKPNHSRARTSHRRLFGSGSRCGAARRDGLDWRPTSLCGSRVAAVGLSLQFMRIALSNTYGYVLIFLAYIMPLPYSLLPFFVCWRRVANELHASLKSLSGYQNHDSKLSCVLQKKKVELCLAKKKKNGICRDIVLIRMGCVAHAAFSVPWPAEFWFPLKS